MRCIKLVVYLYKGKFSCYQLSSTGLFPSTVGGFKRFVRFIPKDCGRCLVCACFWRLPTPLIFLVSGWACHVKISWMWGGDMNLLVEMLSRRNRSTLNSIAQVFRPYQKVHLPQSLASGCGFTTLYFCWTLKKKQLGPQMNWRNQVKVHVMMEPMKIV